MRLKPAKSAKKSGRVDSGQIPAPVPRPSRAERLAMGKRLRDVCPRSSHAAWTVPPDRPDPVRLVLEADEGRLPELLPLRHGRMALSPFTFYRGSALAMAVDLAATRRRASACSAAETPTWSTSGVSPQSCSPSTT